MTLGRLSASRRALYLSLPSVLFVCLLAAAELFVRHFGRPVSTLELFVASPEQHHGFADKNRVLIFEGDPLLTWRLRPRLDRVIWDFTLVSTNPQHLRHPRPLGPKPAGGFRVLCLGDSVTFGYRVPVVHPKVPSGGGPSPQPYPRLLEERLRAANPGREIEVIALAVPGYSSQQGRAWLQRDVDDLRPDLVTACFGWNDVGLRAASDRVTMRSDALRMAARAAAARSQLLAHLALALRKPPPTPAPVANVLRVGVEDFVANHVAMAETARAHGAGMAVIGTVYRDDVTFPDEAIRLSGHRGALRAAMTARGIPYLEIPELTEARHPANAALFGELIHPNALGHRVLADGLLAFLSERGLLKGLAVPSPP